MILIRVMKEQTQKLMRALRYNRYIHGKNLRWLTVEGGDFAYQVAGKTPQQLAKFHRARLRQATTSHGESGHEKVREFLKRHFDKPIPKPKAQNQI